MDDLKNISKKALLAELHRREELENKVEEERVARQRECWLNAVGTLLQLVPEHGRTSCSDDEPHNTGRCTRCDLLQVKRDQYWPEDLVLDLHIVTLRKT